MSLSQRGLSRSVYRRGIPFPDRHRSAALAFFGAELLPCRGSSSVAQKLSPARNHRPPFPQALHVLLVRLVPREDLGSLLVGEPMQPIEGASVSQMPQQELHILVAIVLAPDWRLGLRVDRPRQPQEQRPALAAVIGVKPFQFSDLVFFYGQRQHVPH